MLKKCLRNLSIITEYFIMYLDTSGPSRRFWDLIVTKPYIRESFKLRPLCHIGVPFINFYSSPDISSTRHCFSVSTQIQRTYNTLKPFRRVQTLYRHTRFNGTLLVGFRTRVRVVLSAHAGRTCRYYFLRPPVFRADIVDGVRTRLVVSVNTFRSIFIIRFRQRVARKSPCFSWFQHYCRG